MAYFKDLSEYSYFGEQHARALNVGWLGKSQAFPTGETSEAFQTALNDLCNNNSIRHSRGHHVCELCHGASWDDTYYRAMGNGEIRVRDADGIWYVAPRLVIHYVLEHRYCPPQDFIEAVMHPSEVGKDEPMQFGETDEMASSQDFERRMRELRGPPIGEAEIDRIARRGILQTQPRKPWWRLW
jgi:hypothetical protein